MNKIVVKLGLLETAMAFGAGYFCAKYFDSIEEAEAPTSEKKVPKKKKIFWEDGCLCVDFFGGKK